MFLCIMASNRERNIYNAEAGEHQCLNHTKESLKRVEYHWYDIGNNISDDQQNDFASHHITIAESQGNDSGKTH